jgi:hypothetical protein
MAFSYVLVYGSDLEASGRRILIAIGRKVRMTES